MMDIQINGYYKKEKVSVLHQLEDQGKINCQIKLNYHLAVLYKKDESEE